MKNKNIKLSSYKVDQILKETFFKFEVSSDTGTGKTAPYNEDIFLSGGAIPSLLLGEEPNDYDLYFKTSRDLMAYMRNIKLLFPTIKIRIKGKYFPKYGTSSYFNKTIHPSNSFEFVHSINDDIIEEEVCIQEPYTQPNIISVTTNAVTLKDKRQIVTKFYGAGVPNETFDFLHNTIMYFPDNSSGPAGLRNISKTAISAIDEKKLVFTGNTMFPLATLFRVKKFMERGWSIDTQNLLKIMFRVSQLDLTSIDVLEEQLRGSSYFHFRKIVECLRESESIDEKLLFKTIDDVFSDINILAVGTPSA